ncbi:MAG: aminoglycoside 3-N-acetyltransferase [Devosia sp.]
MTSLATRSSLGSDLTALGLNAGDSVLVHAGLRSVGKTLGGAQTLLDALADAVGQSGTILGYADWESEDEILEHPELRDEIRPFDPRTSRSTRDNGFFPEMLRTTPGALRGGNPGASMAAIGGKAEWFIADHALDYGYGPQSPLGKLVADNGKTLLIGCTLDHMTLLHHAEHLADFMPKRIRRYEAPMLVDGKTVWRQFEEFDTSNAPDGLAEDYFATIVEDFLATGKGKRGTVGAASSVLVEAREIVPFAIDWIETWFRSAS